MLRLTLLLLTLLSSSLGLAAAAQADHIVGIPCRSCASHDQWPRIDIDNVQRSDKVGSTRLVGSAVSDELMGHHTSDVLRGLAGADVLWGDYDPFGQPYGQVDRIFGGAGNDAISVHYGRGLVDCGPGRDIYHVARSRKRKYRFRNCEKVDYRTERQRGGGLKPLR